MDTRVDSNTPTQLSNYVQYTGTLTVSGTYYNITNIDGATTAKGSISFPLDTEFTALNGQEVTVKGYFVGISSSQYYNTMVGSIEASTVPEPILTTSVSQLSGFQYTYGNGPSEAQSFTVSGSNLTANVALTAPENFEICQTQTGTYSSTLQLIPTEGTLAATTIYVRMAAGLDADSYSGNLTAVSGTLSQTVALSGSVTDAEATETPTFSPDPGNFITAQTVSISCTTENAVIYYTTDNSDPTENSMVYSEPITISTTTTLKAIAIAPNHSSSAIATATYTINEPIDIASARALANNEYALVEGTIIFIDGRNVHIQDATAGIDLYLNSNTVPSSLAIGDLVRAYGMKTVYNHLVELSGINGGDANVFAVISTGNDLPTPSIQTIGDINNDFDGDNMLQSTRVTIQGATIGAINPNGTTVISQGSYSLNIYHIPTVEGMTEGDWVTLTGIVSCYNGALQLRVISADDIQFTHRPTIIVEPTSLSGFTYDYDEGGPSDTRIVTVAGSHLISNVKAFAPESYEVSTSSGEMFNPQNPAMIFPPQSGSFYGIKIYVRLKANLEAGTYDEQLAFVSQDADTVYVNLSGIVTGGTTPEPPTPPTPPTPGDGNYVRISELGQLVDSSYVVFAARFDQNATDYYAMSNSSSGKPTGVLFTSAISEENEVLPASIVDEESSYYWVVVSTENGYTFTNAAGEMIGYSSSTNFYTGGDNTEWNIEVSTAGDAAMVPGYTGFVIGNVNNDVRAFALNSNHNFGPYHTQNLNGSGYNFYLDIFMKTEGITPPTPPTPTVATPTFTPAAGTYYETQTVSITCTTEGATIHYTLDGTDPTENSPVYSEPLTIAETTTIKAIAMKEDYNDSNIAEATYTIQLGVVVIFNQDWEGDWHGWTEALVTGDSLWHIATYQGNHYAFANGYNHPATEDWLISPAFNLDAYSNPMLSFRTAMKFNGPEIEVYFSNDYDGEDPTAATWSELTCPLSTGNYEWVESGNIDLSSFSGNGCYIGFKYTCEDGSAAAWEVDDILLVGQTSEPVVTVTPLALNGFTYIEGNGPSAEQSFTVSGLNLSDNVSITETDNFEISLTSGNDFNAQSNITLVPEGGNIEETTIYVRLKAGLEVGDYEDETIIISSADADDIEVICSGAVTVQPIPGGDYVRISNASQLVAGNQVILAARYNETANAYLAIANTLTSGKPATTEFTSQMNGTEEIIPADIMADEDTFYWTVDVTNDGYTFTNANGDMIGYGSSGTNFVMNGEKTVWTIESGTSGESTLVPNYLGFNIVNFTTDTRAFAVRFYNEAYTCGAYATSNMSSSQADQYNFSLDIFMQGEGGVPPTPSVAAPNFTPAAGTYYETQEVTISCTTDGATIYYSLDSEAGPWEEYEEAITVDESLTIWAYAEKEGYNDSPVVSAEYVIQNDVVIIFNQDWEDDWNGWTQVSVEGDEAEWTIAEHSGNHYAYMNGFNHGANEDWLISPAFDLDSYSDDVILTFLTAMNYNGPDIEVFFSNDYDGQDPTDATWEQLTCELSSGSWNWTESGAISLDAFSGTNCYIAFKYTCSEDAAAAWEVDDIMLTSGGVVSNPTITASGNTITGLTYIEGEGPSDPQTYTLTAANLNGEGNIQVTASENFEISLDDDIYGEELFIPYADGIITEQPVTIYVRLAEGLDVGSYEGLITHAGGDAYTEITLSGTVHSLLEPMIGEEFMPMYIQGNNGSNNNRVPVATAVYIYNLESNTTYRYTNQFVDSNDGPETAGAGNVIYTNEDGFYRSTSPSLATEGGYGEFTTNENGEGFVWFVNEPTANARFTPGNHVYLRIRINDGHDGTTVANTFTTENYATVLNYDNEIDEYSGSAFYAKSNETPMSFAMMFAESNDLRPIYSTPIETTGIEYGSINQYANFYKELVAGNDGWFGGILPNDNETGVNSIWIYDLDGQFLHRFDTEEGQWAPDANTVNPTNGLNEPIFIDLTDDGVDEATEANVSIWSADHEFVIENGDNTNYTMTVYNVLGQPMMKHQVNAGSTERFSHCLATGLYVISLQNNQNKVAVKVIVR